MLNILRKSALFFGVITLAVVVCAMLYNFINGASPSAKIVFIYASFILSAFLFVGLVYKIKVPEWTIYLCLAFLSMVYQLVVSCHAFFSGEGDLQFYYTIAKDIAENNLQYPNKYGAIFPSTITYPYIVSIAMNVLGSTTIMAPVLINHFAVSAVVCAMYYFFKQRMSTPWAVFGSLIIVLHPFILIYSNTSNAELVFSACVLLSFVFFLQSTKADRLSLQLIWGSVSALLCWFSTFFRPLAIIMIIAYAIYIFLYLPWEWTRKAILYSVIAVIFFAMGIANNILIKSLTSYNTPSSSYGWNLFVGASQGGVWNHEDSVEFSIIEHSDSSPSDIHEYFANKAFERYKVMGTGFLNHAFGKLKHWFSYEYIADQTTMTYYENYFQHGSSRGVVLALSILVDAPLMLLTLVSAILILLKTLKNKFDELLILVFYLIGSFMVLMILEIAPRYTVSYRMLFCVLSICFIHSSYKFIRNKAIGDK